MRSKISNLVIESSPSSPDFFTLRLFSSLPLLRLILSHLDRGESCLSDKGLVVGSATLWRWQVQPEGCTQVDGFSTPTVSPSARSPRILSHVVSRMVIPLLVLQHSQYLQSFWNSSGASSTTSPPPQYPGMNLAKKAKIPFRCDSAPLIPVLNSVFEPERTWIVS